MKAGEEFFNLYHHDCVRVAVALPALKVADPTFNGFQTVEMMTQAARRDALVVLFPELGVSAYSCEDLFSSARPARRMPRGVGANRQGERIDADCER